MKPITVTPDQADYLSCLVSDRREQLLARLEGVESAQERAELQAELESSLRVLEALARA